MAARVSRFYGRDVMWWLTVAPLIALRRCSAMLPRLSAEESLLAVERTAVATGSFKEPKTATDIMAGWRRSLAPVKSVKPERPSPTALAAIGIGVRRMPRSA